MTIDYRLPIGSLLAQIADAPQEECARDAAGIDPRDRATTEAFVAEMGGWEQFASFFPYMASKASEEEHLGRLGLPKRATIVGHTLIAREHGITLHVQRLM